MCGGYLKNRPLGGGGYFSSKKLPGVYLGFFKWAGTPKSKWAGTAPPQSGQALKKWGGTKKKPAAGADFFTKKWAGSGGGTKKWAGSGGAPKIPKWAGTFQKSQKVGGH